MATAGDKKEEGSRRQATATCGGVGGCRFPPERQVVRCGHGPLMGRGMERVPSWSRVEGMIPPLEGGNHKARSGKQRSFLEVWAWPSPGDETGRMGTAAGNGCWWGGSGKGPS